LRMVRRSIERMIVLSRDSTIARQRPAGDIRYLISRQLYGFEAAWTLHTEQLFHTVDRNEEEYAITKESACPCFR
jgi:hypothetical protein